MPGGSISMRGDQNWKQNSTSRWYSRARAKRSFPYLKMCHFWWTPKSRVFPRELGSFPYLKCKYDAIWSHMDSHGPAWVFIILSILCRKRVWIEVELLLQNRPPLSLWSLIWTGWKPRFHRFFEDFKGRKDALIVCAVSAAPFSFFENVWFLGKDAYFRELLRISKKEKWVDFCL